MGLVNLSVICIVTLLGGLYAQSPPLSPSFSLRGTGAVTGATQATIDSLITYNDANRRLLLSEVTTTVSGQQVSVNVLSSGADNAAFVTSNGQCTRIDPGSMTNLLDNTDPWGTFTLANTVGPVTTYNSDANAVLTLTSGVPTGLTSSVTSSGQTTVTALIITSYTNSAPAFSVFQLDPACVAQNYTCGSCYSSAIGIASNSVYIIAALVVLSILSIA